VILLNSRAYVAAKVAFLERLIGNGTLG